MLFNLCKKITMIMSFFIICFSVVQAAQDFNQNYKSNDMNSVINDLNQYDSLMTKPNIIVSIEPLYELVSSLSHGVVKPEVIYINFSDISRPLSSWQQAKLLDADIIVRVGKGFEPQLDDFLNLQGKPLQNKTITLTNYIPLLDKSNIRAENPDAIFTDRQANSDLRFWMDPRLVKALTDFIAPQLVTMDPIHYEEYLDNEIILRAQLNKIENKMVSLFRELSFEQKSLLGHFNPYLKNRYLSFSEIEHMQSTNAVKPGVLSCLKNQSYATIPLNLEYTEKALNSLLHTIEQCSKSTLVST